MDKFNGTQSLGHCKKNKTIYRFFYYCAIVPISIISAFRRIQELNNIL